MTKSVKEKTRLAKIRQHALDGTPVTPDLLKVKFSYRKLKYHESYNYNKKAFNNLYNNTGMYKNASKSLKDNIKPLLIDIANQLKKYDLKLKMSVYNLNNIMHIGLCLADSHKSIVGFIITDKNSDNFSPHVINQESSNNENIRCKLLINEESVKRPFINNISKQMLELIEMKKKFLYDINFESENNIGELSISFKIGQDIIPLWEYFLLSNGNLKYHHGDNLNITEIDIVKAFVKLGLFKITIPEEDMKIENIDAIKELIKLSNY